MVPSLMIASKASIQPLAQTPSNPAYALGMKSDEIREKEGLGAALRWRAAQLAE